MKRILLMMAMAVVFLVLPGCGQAEVELRDKATGPLTIMKADGKSIVLDVEMAIAPETLMNGLMFRTSMPENSGMLFLFPQEDERAFWMRNTLIPLDMIFIQHDGRILSIRANAVPRDETPVHSNGPANAVLEINGGRAGQLGLKAGDVVHHQFFGNSLR